MKNIATIAKKEFFSFTNSALAYTIIVPFLLISVFLYLRTVLVVGEATLRPYFESLPFFLLLLAPALSMKLLTDEYKSNTLEILYSHPLSEIEIVLGKFFGALAFFFFIMVTTLGLPLSLFIYSRPDPGQIFGQYLGAIFAAATFISIGLAASSYVKNAISSFLLSAAASFVFLIIGLDLFSLMLPYPFNRIAVELSVLTHMDNIARGLIDIRDIAYFATVAGVFITLTVTRLSERKLAEYKSEKRKLKFAFILILGIGISLNLFLSFYPLRIDMTQSRLFTLSQGTKQTIKNLPDITTVTLFASRNLPAQMQLNYQEVVDLLKDYQRLSGKLKVRILDPEGNFDAKNEAQSSGIREITFNKIGASSFEVQKGFLGLSIRFGDKTESIPFIENTGDIEYQLTRKIRKLTSDKEQTIGILKNGQVLDSLLSELISTQYKTKTVSAGNKDYLKDISALLVLDDGSQVSTAAGMIKEYFENKGKILFLSNGVTISKQALIGEKSKSTLTDFLKDYGLAIQNDLVYDLQLNEILSFGRGNTQYLTPYPFWLKAVPEADIPPLSNIKSISTGWVSSIKTEEKTDISLKKLLTTSQAAGNIENSFNISPESVSTLSTTGKDKFTIAASLEKGESRMIVIGTTTLIEDQFLQNNPDNVSFISNTIDWLAADKDLALIPSKSEGRPLFEFRSPIDLLIVQWGNLIIPPVFVVAYAIFKINRRRKSYRRVYEK